MLIPYYFKFKHGLNALNKKWFTHFLIVIFLIASIPYNPASSLAGGINFVPAGPKGMPRGYTSGDRFTVRILGGDCAKPSLPVPENPVAGTVVQMVASLPDGSFEVVMGSARGVAQLVVHCLDDPKMEPARMLVTNNGGYGPFEATEIRSWLQEPPPPLQFSESQKQYLREQIGMQPEDSGGSDSSQDPENQAVDDSMGIGSVILLGAAVGTGLVVAAAAAGGGGLSAKTTCCENSSHRICNTSWGLVCCPRDYPVACPNRKCYAIGRVPSGTGDCLLCRPDNCITNNISGLVVDPSLEQIISSGDLSDKEQCMSYEPDQQGTVTGEPAQ